jgi:hypothetical protein
MKIAQHFNAGSRSKTGRLVPPGTAEDVFGRPWRDLLRKAIAIPSAEALGYYHSQRDAAITRRRGRLRYEDLPPS